MSPSTQEAFDKKNVARLSDRVLRAGLLVAVNCLSCWNMYSACPPGMKRPAAAGDLQNLDGDARAEDSGAARTEEGPLLDSEAPPGEEASSATKAKSKSKARAKAKSKTKPEPKKKNVKKEVLRKPAAKSGPWQQCVCVCVCVRVRQLLLLFLLLLNSMPSFLLQESEQEGANPRFAKHRERGAGRGGGRRRAG